MKRIKTELIDEFIKKNNLTKSKFCKMAGISLHTLNNFYTGKRIRIDYAIKVVDALHISLTSFVEIID